MSHYDRGTPSVDQPTYTLRVDPSLAKPKIEQGVITGAAIVQGREQQFALGCQPLNQANDGGFLNVQSYVLPAINERGRKTVCKFNRMQSSNEGSVLPEARLLMLANTAGVSGVAELLDVGTISFDAGTQSFNTGKAFDNRACSFVEDVREVTRQKPFENLLIFEAVNYARAELNVIHQLHQATGITYRDTDDVVGTDPDRVGEAKVMLYDFGAEKCDGVPLDNDLIKDIATLVDFAFSPKTNRKISVAESSQLLAEVRKKVYDKSQLMANAGLLDEDTYASLQFVLDESNFRKISGTQKPIERLKAITEGQSKLDSFNINYYEALDKIATKVDSKNINYASIMGYNYLYTRRLNPILDKLGIREMRPVEYYSPNDAEIIDSADKAYTHEDPEIAKVLKSIFILQAKANQITARFNRTSHSHRDTIGKYFHELATTEAPSQTLNNCANQVFDAIDRYDDYQKHRTVK